MAHLPTFGWLQCQSHGYAMGFLWAFLNSQNFHGFFSGKKPSQHWHLTDRKAIGHLTFGTSEACHEAWNNFSPVSWIPRFGQFMHISYIWLYEPIIAFLMKLSSHGFHVEVNFSWTWINIKLYKHTKNYHLHESTSKTSFSACQVTFGQVDIMGAPARSPSHHKFDLKIRYPDPSTKLQLTMLDFPICRRHFPPEN